MAYNDNDDFLIFPTRFGKATGGTNERKMLDAVGGADGIRKRLKISADGKETTRLTTRAGNPKFITEVQQVEAEETATNPLAYLESGQLAWTFPGEENPTRLLPAKWHFIGSHPLEEYMGEIQLKGWKFGKQSDRQNGTLVDEQDSLAIGYPQTGDPVIDAATRDEATDITVMKKVVGNLFPPGIFSGKFRLFLQAQYGAKQPTRKFPYKVTATSEAYFLYYNDSFQLSSLGHRSCGLFTDNEFNYWLLLVVGGPVFSMFAHKLILSDAGKVMRTWLKKNKHTLTPEGIRKVEAYILADAKIGTTNGEAVGTFDSGALGDPISYGWKFNSTGGKARINLTQQVNVGTTDAHYRTKAVELTITRTNGVWELLGAVTDYGEWIDGWGVYNIFKPTLEFGGQLELYSLRIDAPFARAPFAFSGVEIYGFYDKDDTWVPVTISGGAEDTFERRQEWQGFHCHTTQSAIYGDSGTETLVNMGDYLYAEVVGGGDYIDMRNGKKLGYAISAGSFSYSGDSRYSTDAAHITKVCTNAGAKEENWSINYVFNQAVGVAVPELATGYAAAQEAVLIQQGSTGGGQAHVYLHNAGSIIVRTVTSGIAGHFKSWAMVIPTGDSESVYVATLDQIYSRGGASITTKTNSTTGYEVGGVVGTYFEYMLDLGTGPNNIEAPVVVTTEGDREVQTLPNIMASCRVGEIDGTNARNYTRLFMVPKEEPLFTAGMAFNQSFGQKYAGTDVNSVPPSADGQRLFVGWA